MLLKITNHDTFSTSQQVYLSTIAQANQEVYQTIQKSVCPTVLSKILGQNLVVPHRNDDTCGLLSTRLY